MSLPSLYKPAADISAPVNPNTVSDSVGVATTAVQPPAEVILKRVLAVLVAGCTAIVPFLSPTSDTFALKACGVVIGIGAALGITSRGVQPKP